MNNRIGKLRDTLHVDKYPLSVQKKRLWTEWFKKTESGPTVVQRAKTLTIALKISGVAVHVTGHNAPKSVIVQ